MSGITPEERAELRRLEKAATPAPWDEKDAVRPVEHISGLVRWPAGAYMREADHAVVLAARNALPRLLDALEKAEQWQREARLAIKDLETERDALRQQAVELRRKNTEFHRRAQQAEGVANENVEQCRRAGVTFGRQLANYAAAHFHAKLKEAGAERDALKARVQELESFECQKDDYARKIVMLVERLEKAERAAATGAKEGRKTR